MQNKSLFHFRRHAMLSPFKLTPTRPALEIETPAYHASLIAPLSNLVVFTIWHPN